MRGEIAEARRQGRSSWRPSRACSRDVVEEQVCYVNAPLLAAERGVEVALVDERESPDHRNLVTVRGGLAGARSVSRQSARSSGPAGWRAGGGRRLRHRPGADRPHGVLSRYDDRPGVVGDVGRILGDEGVNIAGMQVSRDEQGGHALIAMTVDSPSRPRPSPRSSPLAGARDGARTRPRGLG